MSEWLSVPVSRLMLVEHNDDYCTFEFTSTMDYAGWKFKHPTRCLSFNQYAKDVMISFTSNYFFQLFNDGINEKLDVPATEMKKILHECSFERSSASIVEDFFAVWSFPKGYLEGQLSLNNTWLIMEYDQNYNLINSEIIKDAKNIVLAKDQYLTNHNIPDKYIYRIMSDSEFEVLQKLHEVETHFNNIQEVNNMSEKKNEYVSFFVFKNQIFTSNEKSSLVGLPVKSDYFGYNVWVSNKSISETSKENRMKISVPKDFSYTIKKSEQGEDGEWKVVDEKEITGEELANIYIQADKLFDNREDYVRFFFSEKQIYNSTDTSSLIALPHGSEYDGYVVWVKSDYINPTKNENRMYASVKKDHKYELIKTVRTDKGEYETVDRKEVSGEELASFFQKTLNDKEDEQEEEVKNKAK